MTFPSQGGHIPTMQRQSDLPCPWHPHPSPSFGLPHLTTRKKNPWAAGGTKGTQQVLWHLALPRGTMAMMSRLLPCPKMRDRELGPPQAARPACIPQQQDRQMGCQEGTVQAVWCPLPQEEARQQFFIWLYTGFTLQRFPGGRCHLPPALPSSAQQLGPLPTSPAACTNWGQTLCPAGLPKQEESLSSRDAEPLAALWLSRGPWGQLSSTAHSPPRHRMAKLAKGQVSVHQPPVRKSIHFITDPKAPVAVPGGPHLHRMFPLFSKGKRRGEQTHLTRLTALWC